MASTLTRKRIRSPRAAANTMDRRVTQDLLAGADGPRREPRRPHPAPSAARAKPARAMADARRCPSLCRAPMAHR